MNKLVLIDGHAIMYRAFHAMPPLTSKNGEPIGAIQGLVSMILRIIQDLKPTHIAVVFDEKEKTFRQDMLPTYQAQRAPMPDELSPQFDKAKDFLDAARIPVYSKSGFEADDVIGTLATHATKLDDGSRKLEKNNESRSMTLDHISKFEDQSSLRSSNFEHRSSFDEVIIVTGDRDQLQLVDDKKGIKLYMPVVGLTNAKIFGEKETFERMGVGPNLIDHYKALVGDPSDNYNGVPGIGPITAIKLLEEFGTFEEIYRNLDKIPEKVRVKLENGKESGEVSKKLATIVRDVPIEFDFDKMSQWKLDSPQVLNLFIEDFGFKTLTERVRKIGKEIDQEKQGSLF